jgi:alanine dehydrogenase
MLGGITGVRPAEVVILGAGIVGEFATKAAIGLGASVKVFDNSLIKIKKASYHGRQPCSYFHHRS